MTAEANTATFQQAIQHLNAGEIDAGIDMLFAEDAVDHDPAPGQGPGRAGFRSFFQSLTTGFPDALTEPNTMVADGEQVALAYTLTGHHQGEFRGVAATGNRIEVRGVEIARFHSGQIVERWGSIDELGLMQQIGAVPMPPKKGVLGKVADALTP